jgi:hypothetical protein
MPWHGLEGCRQDTEDGVLVVVDQASPLIVETCLLRGPLGLDLSPLRRHPRLGVLSRSLARASAPSTIEYPDTAQSVLFEMPVHGIPDWQRFRHRDTRPCRRETFTVHLDQMPHVYAAGPVKTIFHDRPR